MNLIEKAKSRVVYRKMKERKMSKGEADLAIAWLAGEVTMSQAAFALDRTTDSGNVLYRLAVFLKEAYKRGMLKAVKGKSERGE